MQIIKQNIKLFENIIFLCFQVPRGPSENIDLGNNIIKPNEDKKDLEKRFSLIGSQINKEAKVHNKNLIHIKSNRKHINLRFNQNNEKINEKGLPIVGQNADKEVHNNHFIFKQKEKPGISINDIKENIKSGPDYYKILQELSRINVSLTLKNGDIYYNNNYKIMDNGKKTYLYNKLMKQLGIKK